MIERTLTIVGPGGIGKSPLDRLFRHDVIRIDPYRLRSSGPRDSNDVYYVHPRLRDEMLSILAALGDRAVRVGASGSRVEWFPKGQVLFFEIRGGWQLLILSGLEGQLAKAELHAPILATLLSHPETSSLLGRRIEVIILNPAPQSVMAMQDWQPLEKKTRHNCTERGDTDESIQKRVGSAAQEGLAWKQLIQEHAATEYHAWEFPEYLYKRPAPGTGLLEHQRQMLIKARHRLLAGNPGLRPFFKRDDEIERIDELIVR
jgi:hypothetical protein